MIFLNIALLFGALAAAIPLIIHLLHRTKVRIVPWAAMQFLTGAIEKRSRKLQWQQWLLLAIRCSIPALLAAAMAQPALTWIHNKLGANSSAQQFVVVDTSMSMLADAGDSAAQPKRISMQTPNNFDSIIQAINSHIATPQLFESQALAANTADSPRATTSNSLHDQVLRQFESSQLSVADQLKSAIEELEPQVEFGLKPTLVVVTDMRQKEIEGTTAETRRQIRSLLNSGSSSPDVFLLPLHPLQDKHQTTSNLAVHVEPSSDSIIGPKQSARLDFSIANFSEQPEENVVIDIRLNGQTQATLRLNLAAGQVERRSLQTPPLPLGDHVCEIVCDRNDRFLDDNHAYWTLQSIAPESVLVITGPSRNSSSDYLQFAIHPPSLSDDGDIDESVLLPRQFEILGPVSFNDHGKLRQLLENKPKHVVLCDIPQLDSDLLEKVLETTRLGSLSFFAGKSLDVRWLNQTIKKYPSILPFEVVADTRIASEGTSLVFQRQAKSSIANTMLDSMLGLESRFELRTFWSIQPTAVPSETPSSDTALQENNLETANPIDVLAIASNQSPVLCLLRDNQRIVLFSACDFAPDETNFPLSAAYVPFVQSFYQSMLRSTRDNRNLIAKTRLPIAIDGMLPNESSSVGKNDNLPATDQANSRLLTWHSGYFRAIPTGTSNNSESKKNSELPSFVYATQPGVYHAVNPTDQAKDSVVYATSQMPWSESDLTIADRSTVLKFAEEIGARLYEPDNPDESLEASADNKIGRWNIWRIALLLLLVALLGELLLQRHLARSLA